TPRRRQVAASVEDLRGGPRVVRDRLVPESGEAGADGDELLRSRGGDAGRVAGAVTRREIGRAADRRTRRVDDDARQFLRGEPPFVVCDEEVRAVERGVCGGG